MYKKKDVYRYNLKCIYKLNVRLIKYKFINSGFFFFFFFLTLIKQNNNNNNNVINIYIYIYLKKKKIESK